MSHCGKHRAPNGKKYSNEPEIRRITVNVAIYSQGLMSIWIYVSKLASIKLCIIYSKYRRND